MSIKYVILGFLSDQPMTGYDLKKRFSESDIFHWSGNNNQIYRTLVELHQENWVTIEVYQQDNKPPRKVYTITDAGQDALRQWLRATPELPQFRHPLMLQLNWSEQILASELMAMLEAYAEELRLHLLQLRERNRRLQPLTPMKERIAAHWLDLYERELKWVEELRQASSRSLP